ncbi:hypothetical protein HID58_078456, partial [Brassica napus]
EDVGTEKENVSQRHDAAIDEIENMINNDGSVLPARPSIPVTSSPFVQSNLPPLPPPSGDFSSSSEGSKTMGFGSPANTQRLGIGIFGGPFFFIVFFGLTLSWSASVKNFQSEVFAVAFALLAAGAVILTLNVLLLGGHIIFFQSLSLLGYCLFPPDVGAVICIKALALYPLFLMHVSVGFLIIAID